MRLGAVQKIRVQSGTSRASAVASPVQKSVPSLYEDHPGPERSTLRRRQSPGCPAADKSHAFDRRRSAVSRRGTRLARRDCHRLIDAVGFACCATDSVACGAAEAAEVLLEQAAGRQYKYSSSAQAETLPMKRKRSSIKPIREPKLPTQCALPFNRRQICRRICAGQFGFPDRFEGATFAFHGKGLCLR